MSGRAVTVTSLELTDPAAIVSPSRPAPAGLTITRSGDAQINHDLYHRIGGDFRWTDRLPWPAERWTAWAAAVETHVARLDGTLAGYYELHVQGGSAEVAIFGLLEHARGHGAGGHLLAHALRRGLELAPRVWLHTCTDDGPQALPNYRARGLRVFKAEPA
jgi:GNAT superfamily N-acetyltransferase